MKILVLNCGSSSLKYQLFDMDNESVLAKGLCERIAIGGSELRHQVPGKEDFILSSPMDDHTDAVKLVLETLLSAEHGVIKNLSEVAAVGHRVVHGGEDFVESALITEDVKRAIERCADLAPLHNPPNLIGINAVTKIMGDVKQVAVFDTAFHQTMPERAYLYGVPYEYYEKYRIRKYGFHGTSHRYVAERAVALLQKPAAETKVITCHLGNGASVCAVEGGRSVDTSMGLTPLEGLMMGTRSGDLDPAVISYLAEKEKIDAKGVINILNKQSGVQGISGVSSDFRDIDRAAAAGNERAKTALNMFTYRVAKYIGEYAVAMNGLDAVVFTAGLGENSSSARASICSYLGCLGAEMDGAKNGARGVEADFSRDDSRVRLFIIPTNEELVIARDAAALL